MKLTKIILLSSLFLPCLSASSAEMKDLVSLSLEEFSELDVLVTSGAKKEQPISDTATAIYVISKQDIKRTGARNIPDVLRLVPGLHVARVNPYRWAISSRGDNDAFARSMLVLVDGRTSFNLVFSGVFWDVKDLPLEEIERIEVIRGAGASIWGANAVNGVINIITKSADSEQGSRLSVGVGNEEHGFASYSVSDKVSEKWHYRFHTSYRNIDNSVDQSGNNFNDAWRQYRATFKLDWQINQNEKLSFNGLTYDSEGDATIRQFSFDTITLQEVTHPFVFSGGDVSINWRKDLSDNSHWHLRSSFESIIRDDGIQGRDHSNSFETEFTNRFPLAQNHDFIWGISYRQYDYELELFDSILISPSKNILDILAIYFNDQITLIPNELSLLVGARYEKNDFTDTEFQPDLRLVWNFAADQSIWASLSKAVRVPALSSHNAIINTFGVTQNDPQFGGLYPSVVVVDATDNSVKSEEITSFDIGYRRLHGNKWRYELNAYYNDFDNIESLNSNFPTCEPSGQPFSTECFLPEAQTQYIEILLDHSLTKNDIFGKTYGAELSAQWNVNTALQFKLAYSYHNRSIKSRFDDLASIDNADRINRKDPNNMFNVLANYQYNDKFDMSFWLRYVDELEYLNVNDYVNADVRFSWQFNPTLTLTLAGKNILKDNYQEYNDFLYGNPITQVESSYYIQASWTF